MDSEHHYVLQSHHVQTAKPTTRRSFDYPGSDPLEKAEVGAIEPNVKTINAKPVAKGDYFLAKTEAMAKARKIYLKMFISGACLVVFIIFAVFSIYWGSLKTLPDRSLNGWIVDFDGGEVGQFFLQRIRESSNKAITWSRRSVREIQSLERLQNDLTEEKAWVAIAIHSGASSRLNDAIVNPSSSYNGSTAITVYGVEARNENAYRSIVLPAATEAIDNASLQFALQFAQRISGSSNSSSLANLISTSPQTLVSPVYYTIDNLRPFNVPVASAATFVGLIYMLILSFFTVVIGYGAREASGMSRLLSYWGIVRLRLISAITVYLFLSLFYSLENLAFQIDFTRKFGKGGFVVFWMGNWTGMMAVGLALESLVTILTTRFLPFFMIFWVIINVSVSVYPIQSLPRIFHYGYAAPFYNISRIFRTVAFDTKNQLGLNFGVLIAWSVISCVTLALFQLRVSMKNQRSNAGRNTPSIPITLPPQ